MNYELAKQLKDAGFPYHQAAYEALGSSDIDPSQEVYAVSLSELIESCGDSFTEELNNNSEENLKGQFVLCKLGKFWRASYVGMDHKRKSLVHLALHDNLIDIPWGDGDTPEEAVAKLWLALNSHIPEKETD